MLHQDSCIDFYILYENVSIVCNLKMGCKVLDKYKVCFVMLSITEHLKR